MPKTSGLGDNLYVGGYNISGDIGSLSAIACPMEPLPCTGIDKSANERFGGLRAGHMEYTSWFNPDAARAHLVLNPLTNTAADVQVQYWRGTTLGSPVAAMIAKEVDYAPKRGEDGSLIVDGTFDNNGYGLEWGLGLTAGQRSDTGALDGTAVDYGAAIGSTAFGGQAYVQIFSFTGTLAAITVQDSTDNISFANVPQLATSSAIGAPGVIRVATTSRTEQIDRYVRVITSGTFSQLTFAVMVVKNLTAVTDG